MKPQWAGAVAAVRCITLRTGRRCALPWRCCRKCVRPGRTRYLGITEEEHKEASCTTVRVAPRRILATGQRWAYCRRRWRERWLVAARIAAPRNSIVVEAQRTVFRVPEGIPVAAS